MEVATMSATIYELSVKKKSFCHFFYKHMQTNGENN